jgi:ketosteroid isomerase-like protein
MMAVGAAEVELVKATYAAINRNDISAAGKAFDQQMEWIEPRHFLGAGTYRGHAEVIGKHFEGAQHMGRGKLRTVTVSLSLAIKSLFRSCARQTERPYGMDGWALCRRFHGPQRQTN